MAMLHTHVHQTALICGASSENRSSRSRLPEPFIAVFRGHVSMRVSPQCHTDPIDAHIPQGVCIRSPST